MLHGEPGLSKSAQIKQLANEMEYQMYDIRLSQMSAMDVRGLPVINHEDKSTEWFRPAFFPTLDTIAAMQEEGYKGLIMFFDELSSAPLAIQASAYQIILDRATGEYKIPEVEGFRIVMAAAGNKLTDGAVVNNMSTALKNRMAHLFVSKDVDGFIAYGLNNDMDTRVVSFIKAFPQNLHKMPKSNAEYAFPTNRSWEFVSNMIKGKTYSDDLETIVASIVGAGAATEFAAHMKIADQLPDLDDVLLNGPSVELDKHNVSLLWAYTMGLTSKMINKRETVKIRRLITSYLH